MKSEEINLEKVLCELYKLKYEIASLILELEEIKNV